MKKLFQRLLLGIVLGVGVYAVGSIYIGFDKISSSLASFNYWFFVPVLALTLTNYFLRYLKWAFYLRVLKITVPFGQNFTIFLGGLSMVVTPGKIGELLKSYLLKTAQNIPMTRTAPIVMAERITDLIALILLMVTGFFTFRLGLSALLIISSLIILFLIIISSKQLSMSILKTLGHLPLLSRISHRLEEFYDHTAAIFRLGPLAIATFLSIASWSCECIGTYLVLKGFANTQVSILLATFIYSATTLGGLPTPGGIGLTDGGMAFLLNSIGQISIGIAGAATLLIRLCTLWFAVLVGSIALLVFRKKIGFGNDIGN